jgi:uncharacterized protein (TIGR02117 family)
MKAGATRGFCRAVLAAIAGSTLAGCSTLPVRPVPDTAPRTATLYVIGRGWHTDIGLAVEEIAGPLAKVEQQFPGVRYLVFGFGERGYLLSRDKDLRHMLLALFPGPGAMLVTALSAPPSAAFGASHVIALRLSQAGIDRVSDFLWGYLQTYAHGAPQVIADGPYPGSLFFASAGTYALGHTCNTWTAEALRAGGLPVSGTGVLFADQVFAQAHHAAESQAERPVRLLRARD